MSSSIISTLTKRQHKKLGPKVYTEEGHTYRITANVCHNDECGNGHNTFSITCHIDVKHKGRWKDHSGGCCHEEFAKHFPEYAHLLKWHLTSTDGPMHYLANTLYLAGDKDHNGLRKGDVSRWSCGVRFGNSPVTHKLRNSFYDFLQARMCTGDGWPPAFQVTAIAHGPANDCGGYKFKPKYTLIGYGERWAQCPFDTEVEALEFCGALNNVLTEFVSIPLEYSEGKERQLDAARNAAVWPDATDEDLTTPGLKERLEARLPALMQEFQIDVCNIGFTY